LLNDILDLSKIEADRLVISQQTVDVAASLNECFESARPLVHGKPVELRRAISETIPPWLGDNIRLRQIVTNLLGNAVKFTESGTIELRAEVAEKDLRIDVEDTGIGIAAIDIPKIFERFQQVDSSSTRRASGTGLGLAICKKLCQLMGGRISVQSEPGVGSCFTVTLPMEQREEETHPSESGQQSPVDPRGRRQTEVIGDRI
jgi:signal transduction histidine kinase